MSLNFMSPQGEFRQNVSIRNWYDIGALGFNLIGPLTPSGWLSMRFEYMFGIYEKSCRGCEFNSVSLGPEVSLPRGPVRPYAMGEWGHLHFTSFNDASGEEADTGVGQWIYGGGVRIPLKTSSGWLLDLGVRKHLGGTVSYVRTPGTRINGDLNAGVDPARTSTPFVLYGVGFQYQFK